MVELIESENAMAGVAASKFLLATGAGVVAPSPPPAQVNIGIVGQPIGFVIDLRSDAERAAGVPVSGARPSPAPVTIEGSASEVVDLAERRPSGAATGLDDLGDVPG
jgi:hypothetical protein